MVILQVVIFLITLWILNGFWRWFRYVLNLRRCFWSAFFCHGCGQEISTIGVFRCQSCGFTYAGWYFAVCRNCGEIPGFIRCEHCEICVRNPLIYREATDRA